MHDHARPPTPQQSITQVAGHIHDVARLSISIAAIELVTYLIDGPQDVSALASATSLDVATVSKRLKDLRDAGLVICRVNGRRRIYQLCDRVTIVTHGEYCLVVVPTVGGIFAIGVARTVLTELHNAGGAQRRVG